jgi:DNA-binding PadR family transcriptional regulator
MSTADTLLALLEPEPAYGYTLKQQHDRWFSRKRPLAFGQVYSTLSRLERKGYVAPDQVESGQGPDRRLYRITPEGVEATDAWVRTAEPPDLFATSSLHARLTVALLSGRDAVGVLSSQRRVHLDRMRDLQGARRKATGAELLGITYELAHLDADLRWIEESGARLAAAQKELEEGPHA